MSRKKKQRPPALKTVDPDNVQALIASPDGAKLATRRERIDAFDETFQRYITNQQFSAASALFAERFYLTDMPAWNAGSLSRCFAFMFERDAKPQTDRFYLYLSVLYMLQKMTAAKNVKELKNGDNGGVQWSEKQERCLRAALACDPLKAPPETQKLWRDMMAFASKNRVRTRSAPEPLNSFTETEEDGMTTVKKTAKKPASAAKKLTSPPKAVKSNGRKPALDYAAEALQKSGKPMRHAEIITAMQANGYKGFPAVQSSINCEIRDKGAESRFKKVSHGTYAYAGK